MGNSGLFQLRAMAHKGSDAASGGATDLPKSFPFEWRGKPAARRSGKDHSPRFRFEASLAEGPARRSPTP